MLLVLKGSTGRWSIYLNPNCEGLYVTPRYLFNTVSIKSSAFRSLLMATSNSILQYLDDWLQCAPTKEQDIHPPHPLLYSTLSCGGLKKSSLTMKWVTQFSSLTWFIGMSSIHWHGSQIHWMLTILSPLHVKNIIMLANQIQPGHCG